MYSPSRRSKRNFPRLRVWCLLRDQFSHVKPLEKFFDGRADFIYDTGWEPHRMLAEQPDIVLCVNDFPYDILRCLEAARRAGIPSLLIQDGILEWRCQYENPAFGAGGGAPQHQPVIADKIACIGPSSARHVASWGNTAKVEVTGMPRLDPLLSRRKPVLRRPGRRILVMTAKKPAFTEAQMRVTLQSLKDVKEHLVGRSGVEVIWRLTKDLAVILGVQNHLQNLEASELADLLENVDAVVSTPSTAMLEAMIFDRPVACLDYHNVPRFTPTAWTISAPQHIAPVTNELLRPPAAKMVFQGECLTDSLCCRGPASPRVAELIEKIVAFSRAAQSNGCSRLLPAYMISQAPHPEAPRLPPLRELYPGQGVFEEDDPWLLQVRVATAEKENAVLKQRLRARGIGYWIERGSRKAARGLKRIELRFTE